MGTGMYLVAGMVAKNVAGPGVVISFIIAAVASIFSGMLNIVLIFTLRRFKVIPVNVQTDRENEFYNKDYLIKQVTLIVRRRVMSPRISNLSEFLARFQLFRLITA